MLTQIEGFDATATRHPRRKTYGVKVGQVQVGGGAPIVVQSMTNTDTADIESTFKQTVELAEAGSEIVRWTVNVPEAAAAVPEIKKRLLDVGCRAPIIGDCHYNGHVLLTKHPECAKQLDKYRINPGNVEAGQPLHLGLTEAGMGMKGQIWSAASLGILLYEGIGDTIRISLTPRPGGDRREEVYAACELLQALGLRSFAPSVTACPGCGRTTSTTFQELAERIQDYIRAMMPTWKERYEGVEEMTLAVMGCVVNGPGESKAANIGISLPGTGEEPSCPVFIDGRHVTTLHGSYDELASEFQQLVDAYVAKTYSKRT